MTDYTEAFERWWKVYPRKEAKQAVFKKWQAKKLADIADEIIAHTEKRARLDKKWKDGYVPMPLTFINQGRWEDVYQTIGTDPEALPAEKPAALMDWLALCDSDQMWAIRMAGWVHQPQQGEIREMIDKYLALPAEQQIEFARKYGLLERPNAKTTPADGTPERRNQPEDRDRAPTGAGPDQGLHGIGAALSSGLRDTTE